MLQAGYTAALGLKSFQTALDTIGSNVANVNTNAYKQVRTDFKDTLYTTIERPIQPQEEDNLRRGHGNLVSGTNRIFDQGIYNETGVETDFYLEGDGFFAISTESGQTLYTRDGAFTKSLENTGTYLVTSSGNYVLDVNGNRIRIEGDSFTVSPEGYISQGEGAPAYAQMQIVQFDNQKGLTAIEGNLFAVSDASGQPVLANGTTLVKQNALERSNVDMAEAFTALIRTQKAFAFSARALSTADEMDGTANALR